MNGSGECWAVVGPGWHMVVTAITEVEARRKAAEIATQLGRQPATDISRLHAATVHVAEKIVRRRTRAEALA